MLFRDDSEWSREQDMDTDGNESVMSNDSSSTGNPLAHGHLPTPVLERMAHAESSQENSPGWLSKMSRAFKITRMSPFMPESRSSREPLLSADSDIENLGVQRVKTKNDRTLWIWLCGALFVVIIIAYFVIMYGVVPVFAQVIMDQTNLSVIRMHMSNPTNETITLTAQIELHDVGEIGATLLSCPVEVIHEGIVLADMILPEMDIVGGEVLKFTLQSPMFVRNASAFTMATAKILQGHGGRWFINGKPKLRLNLLGVKREFHINLYKLFDVPATLLEDVRAKKTIVLPNASDLSSFNVSAKTSFISSSILELYHLGLFIFDLEVLVDKHGKLLPKYSTVNEGRRVKIGSIVFDDFDLRQGETELPLIGVMMKIPGNEDILAQFMSNFVNRKDQPAILKGPVISSSPFLDDVVTQILVFEGIDSQPIDGAYIHQATMNGFHTKVPETGEVVHYRGAQVLTHNPLIAEITLKDLKSQVFMSVPLGYEVNNPLLGKWSCPVSRDFIELFAAPGMYQNEPTRDPVVTMAPSERVTFFLPGRPRPGQIKQRACTVLGVAVAGDYDCCMVSIQAAAACRAKMRGNQVFNVDTFSTFILKMGEFELPVENIQLNVPTIFADEMTKGFLLDAELHCSEFTFYDDETSFL